MQDVDFPLVGSLGLVSGCRVAGLGAPHHHSFWAPRDCFSSVCSSVEGRGQNPGKTEQKRKVEVAAPLQREQKAERGRQVRPRGAEPVREAGRLEPPPEFEAQTLTALEANGGQTQES